MKDASLLLCDSSSSDKENNDCDDQCEQNESSNCDANRDANSRRRGLDITIDIDCKNIKYIQKQWH